MKINEKVAYLEAVCVRDDDDYEYHIAARALNEVSNILDEAIGDIELRHLKSEAPKDESKEGGK
ncbi:MAG: hypothetical protein WC455_23790 [Dehalococcoidia bacterium]|jgi:hypothetical protein